MTRKNYTAASRVAHGRRRIATRSLLALVASVSLTLVGCAQTLECPPLPPPAVVVVRSAIARPVVEAERDLESFARTVWFDAAMPGDHERDFEDWRERTKVADLRCLRPTAAGYRYVETEPGGATVTVHSAASYGGTWLRFETPVLLRAGDVLSIRYETSGVTEDTSVAEGFVAGLSGERSPSEDVRMTRGTGRVAIDLRALLTDEPERYGYFVEPDPTRWELWRWQPLIVVYPVAGGQLDPSRAGYLIAPRGSRPTIITRVDFVADDPP